MVVVRVLEDGLDVDDVLARRSPPVKVDLPPALHVVFQHLRTEVNIVEYENSHSCIVGGSYIIQYYCILPSNKSSTLLAFIGPVIFGDFENSPNLT